MARRAGYPIPMTIIPAIRMKVPRTVIAKRPAVKGIRVTSTSSAYPKFHATTHAGIADISNNKTPSPIRRPQIPQRVDPKAIRNAISARRCCVRNQKVPIMPKKIFSNKKNMIQNCVFNSFTESVS